MSRVGKKPIPIPDKTKVTYKDRVITVQGEKGTLKRVVHPDVDLKIEDGTILVTVDTSDRKVLAFQRLTLSLIANMVTGVTKGFERQLEVNGIGYRVIVKGKALVLNLGYSNPVNFDLPEGISAKTEKTTIILSGIDKELLGHTAAAIRRLRPPEPYKGKGIKYKEEYIQRKAGKTGAAAA